MKKRLGNIVMHPNKKKGNFALSIFLILSIFIGLLVGFNNTTVVANDIPSMPTPIVETMEVTTTSENIFDSTTEQPISDTLHTNEITQVENKFDHITAFLSETEKNTTLEKAIISSLEIPNDFLASTRYYYNYMDLNNDGKNEIFVQLVGPYTSGSGGDTALILNNSFECLQILTLVRNPIIISDTTTNGWYDIIMESYGGGNGSSYVNLKYDKHYSTVSNSETISDISNVKGIAIICNDLLTDFENGNYLTLE